MHDQTAGQPEGISVLEAAAALGLSEKSIYRRIKAGKLHAVKRRTTTGYEWVVYLSGPPAAQDTAPASDDQGTAIVPVAGPSGRADAAVSRLFERHERVTLAYGRLKERYEALERENDELRALLADDVQASTPPEYVPWWRRLLGRLGR